MDDLLMRHVEVGVTVGGGDGRRWLWAPNGELGEGDVGFEGEEIWVDFQVRTECMYIGGCDVVDEYNAVWVADVDDEDGGGCWGDCGGKREGGRLEDWDWNVNDDRTVPDWRRECDVVEGAIF